MLKNAEIVEGENLIKPEIFNSYTAGNSTIAVVIQCNNNELVTTCATGSIPKKELQPLVSSPNIDEWLQQLQHKKKHCNSCKVKKRKGE